MGLAESLKTNITTPKRGVCSVAKILDQLEKKDKDALINSLDSTLALRIILLSLRENKFPIGRESLSMHRNKQCFCYQEKE